MNNIFDVANDCTPMAIHVLDVFFSELHLGDFYDFRPIGRYPF